MEFREPHRHSTPARNLGDIGEISPDSDHAGCLSDDKVRELGSLDGLTDKGDLDGSLISSMSPNKLPNRDLYSVDTILMKEYVLRCLNHVFWMYLIPWQKL